MKHVLLDNAYEAWAMAIKYCNIILNGQATLQYQKFFVSSLHNAVELFIKQLMLNNGDHSVATIQNIKDSDDAELILKYMKATDLNEFFANLSAKEIERFKSIVTVQSTPNNAPSASPRKAATIASKEETP